MNFKNLNPKLASFFNLAELITQGDPRRNFLLGIKLGAQNAFVKPRFDRAESIAYAQMLLALAKKPFPQDWVVTKTDQVFVTMTRLALIDEAYASYHPQLGRPILGLNEVIDFYSWIYFIVKNYAGSDWLTHKFQLDLIVNELTQRPSWLRQALELWFGQGSVGWVNELEREATLQTIDAVSSTEFRASLNRHWQHISDKQNRLDQAWGAWVNGLQAFKEAVERKTVQKETRWGIEGYQQLFDRLYIRHSPQELLDWANEQYYLITQELQRVADCNRFLSVWHRFSQADKGTSSPLLARLSSLVAKFLPDGDALTEHYQQRSSHVMRPLSEIGLVPASIPGFHWKIELTPLGLRSSIPVAQCVLPPYGSENRTAILHVTPHQGDLMLALLHHLATDLSLAHELAAHAIGFGLAPQLVPIEYTLNQTAQLFGLEGVAQSMELALMLCRKNPTVFLIYAVLKGQQWKHARAIAELRYHITNMPIEGIVGDYAKMSGISEETARKDLTRGILRPGELIGYVVGTGGIQQLGQQHPQGFLGALREYQTNCGGYIPPNLYAWSKGSVNNPNDFSWLPEVNKVIQVAQELI